MRYQNEERSHLFPFFFGLHLDKSDFALANVTVSVLDGYFPIVLYAALPAQDVVDAGGHLVPLIMVTKSDRNRTKTYIYQFLTAAVKQIQLCVNIKYTACVLRLYKNTTIFLNLKLSTFFLAGNKTVCNIENTGYKIEALQLFPLQVEMGQLLVGKVLGQTCCTVCTRTPN